RLRGEGNGFARDIDTPQPEDRPAILRFSVGTEERFVPGLPREDQHRLPKRLVPQTGGDGGAAGAGDPLLRLDEGEADAVALAETLERLLRRHAAELQRRRPTPPLLRLRRDGRGQADRQEQEAGE